MKVEQNEDNIPFIPKGYKKVTKGKIKEGDLFTGKSGIWSKTSQAGDSVLHDPHLTYIRKKPNESKKRRSRKDSNT